MHIFLCVKLLGLQASTLWGSECWKPRPSWEQEITQGRGKHRSLPKYENTHTKYAIEINDLDLRMATGFHSAMCKENSMHTNYTLLYCSLICPQWFTPHPPYRLFFWTAFPPLVSFRRLDSYTTVFPMSLPEKWWLSKELHTCYITA